MTDQTTDTPTDSNADELVRLRDHNRQLLAELKTARTEAKGLQDAAEAATSAANRWRDRYHQAAVLEPLEADLRGAASGPWKYLRDICVEQKLLTMEPDAEGIERPVWRDERGEPADLSRGLYLFLSDVYKRTPGSDLGHVLRASGVSGGGASSSASGAPTMPPSTPPDGAPTPAQQAAPAYGLR